jgi:hypothetical protein
MFFPGREKNLLSVWRFRQYIQLLLLGNDSRVAAPLWGGGVEAERSS